MGSDAARLVLAFFFGRILRETSFFLGVFLDVFLVFAFFGFDDFALDFEAFFVGFLAFFRFDFDLATMGGRDTKIEPRREFCLGLSKRKNVCPEAEGRLLWGAYGEPFHLPDRPV